MPVEHKDVKKVGLVVSRLDNPVQLSYGGEGLMLPPRGKLKGIQKDKLGALPRGVVFVAQEKDTK